MSIRPTHQPGPLPSPARTQHAAPASRGSPWQAACRPTTSPHQATATHHWRPS